MTIAKKISIESGVTHKYTFTILFKEINANQNYNQGKEFNGVLGIEESKGGVSPVAFSTDSWDTIVSAVKYGDTSVYKVGDTKEINMGEYGTHIVRIANTSTPSECSTAGFSQSACGFVLEFADIITTHVMNDTNTNEGGWPASSMRAFVNNDIYNSLPLELQNGIVNTTLVSAPGDTDTDNFTSIDKIYLISSKELYNENSYFDTSRNFTRQLDYYKKIGVTTTNYGGAKKENKNDKSNIWWLRTDKYIHTVLNSGGLDEENGGGIDWYYNDSLGVSPAFRLG